LSTIPGILSTVPLPTPKVDTFTSESPDNFPRNPWTTSIGMGGQLAAENALHKMYHVELEILTA
jgi:hypothetical protein